MIHRSVVELAATTATVIAPANSAAAAFVVFAYPGGGYSRTYYDMHPRGLLSYSQAQHHADAGIVTVAVDHVVTPGGLQSVALANAEAAVDMLGRLRCGAVPGVQLSAQAVVIAVGQSMGAAVLTVQQARYPMFDAVALLGWSARQTALPSPPPGADLPPGSTRLFRWAYHSDDEPRWLIDADIGAAYPDRLDACPEWGSAERPVPVSDVLVPGCVAGEAAQLDVPVLLGFGSRDVCTDPTAEPAMYRASPGVQLVQIKRMAHMHNFAPTRRTLWERLVTYYRRVGSEPSWRAN